jgi:phage-related protein
MCITLRDIAVVKPEWQTVHKIKALEINGRCPALAMLAEWAQDNKDDFKKLMKSIKLVCQNKRVINQKHVKKSSNPAHCGIYEIRADKGKPRLFFFYSNGAEEIVICTHGWDKKTSQREQNSEFDKCARFKQLYETQTI